MTARRRSIPPSRRRYDEAHPTVAARVDRETRERLNRLAAQSGETLSRLFLQGLGLLERDLAGAFDTGRAKGREEGQREGRKAGFTEAVVIYRIKYPCGACGKLIALRADGASAKAAAEALTSAGWGHAACHRPRG